MKILHLVGSTTSDFYHGISKLYAPGCLEVLPDEDHVILMAQPNGMWSIASTLEEADSNAVECLTLPEALCRLKEMKFDILNPQMYCYQGMVTMRCIADMLDIPLLGSPGHVMALTTDKWQTRAVVQSVGVTVPKGQLLRRGDAITMTLPFILKPCREDNSLGISLVRTDEDIEQALTTAFAFDDLIICEEFIPLGREIRVAVVETEDGSLELLPPMEYFLQHKEQPIRTPADKLLADKSGDNKNLTLTTGDREVLTDVDDALLAKLKDMAVRSHHALGCEGYSLYDVRVDPDGNPFFIEACIFCEFSPLSVIVSMSKSGGKYNNSDLFYRLARKKMREFVKCSGGEKPQQVMGMRGRTHLQNS